MVTGVCGVSPGSTVDEPTEYVLENPNVLLPSKNKIAAFAKAEKYTALPEG